jgi:alpha-L-fucosidase 2
MFRSFTCTLLSAALLAAIGCVSNLTAQPATPAAANDVPTMNRDLKIWFDMPAGIWEEALPLGNGRMGAMVFGGARAKDATTYDTTVDRIQFNEDTLWTGKPHDYVRDGALDALPEIRKLIFEGKADEAAPVVRSRFLSNPVRQKAYQPFGDLRFTFPGHTNVTDYRRELDLDSALATVRYTVGGVTYTREVIASHPADAILVRLTASQPGKVSFGLKMDTPHEVHGNRKVDDRTLALFGQVTDKAKEPIPANEGMKFESRVRVINDGGTVKTGDDAIQVDGADSVTLVLVAATNFVNFRDVSADPAARCAEQLAKLDGQPYDAIKAAHVADHQKLFRRVTIDLGRTPAADRPTNVRLNRVADGVKAYEKALADKAATPPNPAQGLIDDPSFVSLYFQMGRYMLIASSRPGDQPANLQGVWNELRDPPWESKFTTNINLEMNYWPAEVTNLAELHGPLFDMVDDLMVSGGVTAKKQYGAGGWVLHHNTDHWRGTAPINNIDGMWPTGGAWLTWHLWDHYLFSGDKEFLAKRAYPALKGASQFFVDFLIPDPKTGRLVTNPSHSPEQGPLNAGPAMDMQLIRACFDATIEASQILGVDGDFAAKLRDTRAKLVPDQVGKHGQLQEWADDLDQPNNNHRHMSPLWGLYPGDQFTPENAKIFDAAKVLLKWRGDGSTGWSYAWRIPLWARAYDGDFAYRQLWLQLAKRTFPNLFDKCGPFQVDGNFGATGGLVELVLQSHRRVPGTRTPIVQLLPALPASWQTGAITGLRARGGFEVDLAWEAGKLKQATLRGTLGGPVRVQLGDQTLDLHTQAGEPVVIDSDLRVTPR